MDRRDELEQQIWDFVYDLLPEDEAAALRRRIAAEPDLARVHDEVRRQAALLAEAAKLALPPLTLYRPDAEDASPAVVDAPLPVSTVAKPAARPARRWVNWAVGLAASGLLCYLGLASFQTGWLGRNIASRSPEAALADQPVRAVLIGPQQLQPSLTNYVAVQTRNAAGAPVAAKVDYRWYWADGTAVDSGQCQTDASGFTQLTLAKPLRSSAVRLEVEPQTALKNVSLRCSIPVAASELTTYLTTDKTIYRPGEQVRYRTVTLNLADLQVHREVPVAFRVVDQDGQEVNGLGGEVVTKQGVGSGAFELPRFQPAGRQTLIAASPSNDFPQARREIYVRPYRTPTLRQTLDFVRDSYVPGEEVEADLRVELADGEPARNVPLAVTAETGDRKFFKLHTMTNDQGSYRVRFNLPAEVEAGQTVLNVTTGQEVQEQLSERIPIHQGGVTVEFFPESGDLVRGVANRVYFFAYDSLERPVHIRGRVVDGQGRKVAELRTIRDGRGVFALTPARDERYRLLLDQPADVTDQPELPPTSTRQFVALDAGPGVFAPGTPIKVKLASQEGRPVAVVAVCRGLVVGQELVSPAVFQRDWEAGGPEVFVSVAETAEGVIRLTVYDYSAPEPTPVAERLVYRRPARKLSIQPTPPKAKYAPGEAVNLAVSVQDERRRPQSAVLGASVVDEASLSLVRDRSASLTTHFWLLGQIDDVRGLEDANFYLSEGSEAEQALDLLLGTQGWRRFATVPVEQLAQTPAAGQMDPTMFAYQLPVDAVAVSESTAPTVLADNADETSQILRSGLAAMHIASARTVQRVGRVLIVGALILVIMLGLLAAMRRLPATTVWLPALGTSAMCLVLGCVWLVAQGQPASELAKVAWDEPTLEKQVAQADTHPAAASMPESAVSSELARSERKELGLNRETTDKAKGAERKKADENAFARRVLPSASEAATPADESAPSMLAKRAEKLQHSDTDQRGLQLKQKRASGSEARSRPEGVERRSAPGKDEAPRQDALEQLKGNGKPADSQPAPSRELNRSRGVVAGQIAEQAPVPQEPLGELESAPSVAAPAPSAAVPMATPVPAQVMPAAEKPAAARPTAAAKSLQPERATSDAAPEKAEKKAGQLRVGKTSEVAGGLMPGIAAQPAPAPAAGMGGGAGGPVAADAARDLEEQVQTRVAGKGQAAGSGAMYGAAARPSAGAASSGLPALRAAQPAQDFDDEGMGQPTSRDKSPSPQARWGKRGGPTPQPTPVGGEKQEAESALNKLADQPVPPPAVPRDPQTAEATVQRLAESLERSEQRLYRQYAPRSLTAVLTDGLAPPLETVLWEPLLETDARGQATFQFQLPETATTYRVLVDGHAAGRIGSYLGRIIVSPDAKAAPKQP